MTDKIYYGINGLIDIQSFLLLKAGLKPVFRGYSPNGISREIKSFYQNLGFHILEKKLAISFATKAETGNYVYISRSKKMARLAYESEINNDQKTHGEALGYPDCCVDFFSKNLPSGKDFNMLAHKNTLGKPSFYCHSLFNHESKLRDKNLSVYLQNREKFKSTTNLFLIKHIPCSLNCKKSVALGKITLELLKKEVPSLATTVVKALKTSVLYFDYFNWIAFKGKPTKGELNYTDVLPYPSLISEHEINQYKQGNRIKIINNQINIYQNRNLIAGLKKKNAGVIIDFS